MLVLGFRLGLGLGLRLGVRARVGEGLEFSARNDVGFTLNRNPNLNLTLILTLPQQCRDSGMSILTPLCTYTSSQGNDRTEVWVCACLVTPRTLITIIRLRHHHHHHTCLLFVCPLTLPRTPATSSPACLHPCGHCTKDWTTGKLCSLSS